MRKLLWIMAWLLPGLSGCAAPGVETYVAERPRLDLERYFNGTVDAWGMFQDRGGRVMKRFHVTIDASWRDGVGTLDEAFAYSDGSTSRRVWTIRRVAENEYRGTAADVVGEARGEARGNALRWRYVLRLDVDGKRYDVDFDDWMFLLDDEVMLNRSVMSKFGVRLGEVILSFRRRPGPGTGTGANSSPG